MPREPRLPTPFPHATQTAMDFLDSSFFTTEPVRKSLPAPSEVIARSKDFKNMPRPTLVKFESLNLAVKFGPHVVVDEALCLHTIYKALLNKVPVPEVYGWRIEGGYVFLYMELIRGESLIDRWDSLSDPDKTLICDQLREIVLLLRQIKQDPTDPFIGSITRRQLLDYVFEDIPGGPFKNTNEFNDWFSALPQRWLPDSQKYLDPYRALLPDTGAIKFTHGDLHRGNIMISSTNPPGILAVIDWAHAGWYPDYWEYCKALYTSEYDGEWRNIWIPKFLCAYKEEFDAFAEYVMQMGAV